MSRLEIGRARWIVAAGLAVSLAASSAAADTITDARIAVDARADGQVQLRYDLDWTADGEARSSARLYLAEELEVREATFNKQPLDVSSKKADGSLRMWTVKLADKVPAGGTASFTLRAVLTEGNGRGLNLSKGRGVLAPGAAWFPRTSPVSESRPAHTVTFLLPEGAAGVAAGERRGGGIWQSPASRPYAVWGDYAAEAVTGRSGEDVVNFEVWRHGASGAYTPDTAMMAGAVHALEVGLGAAAGAGSWKLVDAGAGISGGSRTVFFDSGASPVSGDAESVRDRDLVAAAAASYWTEAMTWNGPLSGFFSHSFSEYLGDATYSALRDPENRDFLESVTVGSRRDAFLANRANDAALEGLVSSAPGAEELLETRGALVVHLLATAVASHRSRWIVQLQRFRERHRNTPATAEAFRRNLRDPVVEEIAPFLTSTRLPDFRLASHGPTHSDRGARYNVEVENVGEIPAHADVAVYDGQDRQLYRMRMELGPGEKKPVNFGEPSRIARVRLDPARSLLQSDVSGEDETAKGYKVDDAEVANYVPAFKFQVLAPGPRRVTDFALELDGVSISGFNGWLVPYATHHGPTGACLVGQGKVVLAPTGPHAEGWKEAMGRDSMVYDYSKEMWIRFPVKAWERIEPQLGDPVPLSERQDITHGQNWIYQFSFPTYFFERNLAQVPPPGSSTVVFTSSGGQRLGFARVPYPDGTVLVRLWDHMQKGTLWEERR